jgi:hypothetical protein
MKDYDSCDDIVLYINETAYNYTAFYNDGETFLCEFKPENSPEFSKIIKENYEKPAFSE